MLLTASITTFFKDLITYIQVSCMLNLLDITSTFLKIPMLVLIYDIPP